MLLHLWLSTAVASATPLGPRQPLPWLLRKQPGNLLLWVRGVRKGVPRWNTALPTDLQLLHGHLLAMFLAALNENVQGVRVVFALRALQLLTDSLLQALLKDLPSLDALEERGPSACLEGRAHSKPLDHREGSGPTLLPPLLSSARSRRPVLPPGICPAVRFPPKGSPKPSLSTHRVLTLR